VSPEGGPPRPYIDDLVPLIVFYSYCDPANVFYYLENLKTGSIVLDDNSIVARNGRLDDGKTRNTRRHSSSGRSKKDYGSKK
tara:strand:- start:867 stop:1112 length:246 start_codon:yes stop_codon:yes gene_type:complete